MAIAELLKGMGHDVTLISITDNTWWDDCKTLEASFKVVPLKDAHDYDIVFEMDRMMLTTDIRSRVAKNSIWIVRKPFILNELESALFPTTLMPKRDFAGIAQIWALDAVLDAEEGGLQAIELLARVPVHRIPYLWTSSIASAHMKESGLSSWMETTVTELRRIRSGSIQGGDGELPPWAPHVAETNTTNASSSVLPLVILREAKRRGVKSGTWKLHNTEVISKSKFFMENVVQHCTDLPETDIALIGRQRCVEWISEPMSCVVAHSRFTLIRPFLLDIVWAGIPLIHNSPILRDIGCGLDHLYYSENHVGEGCEAMKRMESDLTTLKGIFMPGATDTLRKVLTDRFSPDSPHIRRVCSGLIDSLTYKRSISMPFEDAPLSVGFADMWESFNPEYNFFTLMLAAAGAKMTPPVKVVGGPATSASSVVIFGPFGETWKALPEAQPKIHFTGENTVPMKGPGVGLNLGFHHFDMVDDSYLRFPLWILEIDWFGADASRIVNPKPIPLDLCTKVDANLLARKKKFAAFVVSNPSNPVRNTAFQWLSEYKPVDSAGRLMNTMGDAIFAGAGGGGGEQKKVEFLKDYKFCLAYENNSARGYTTEKFLHAKAAGCIPIYWGDPAIDRDFSLAGAIDARSVKSEEELIQLVRTVDESDSEWLKRFAVPALDSYHVAWCHRTMAECARRIFKLGGLATNSSPIVVGDVVTEPPAVAPPAVTPPISGVIEVPHIVTCTNRKFLPSLQHWLVSISTQVSAISKLKATVYLFPDVPEDTENALKEKFSFVQFRRLPESPPAGAFSDFWDPQHYGWKLWILNEMATTEVCGTMILYMDAGTFLCRWPKEWMLTAQEKGVCLLEDSREENRRWCSPKFCAAMEVTEKELAEQQIQAATICFRAGSPQATRLFKDALTAAMSRDILIGAKWMGVNSEGKAFGHRHDQSILSILSSRQGIQRIPVDSVQCGVSLRKTFTTGRSIYIHRGGFAVHKKALEGIDDAYVINLKRREDRMEKLWTNMPDLRDRVERWPAIEGRTLTLTPAIARVLKPNDFFWKKAVTGCALSHLGLWYKLAHETQDIQNYLILEDDVKFNPNWEVAWKTAVADGDIPEDYDILYLGGVLPPNRGSFKASMERFNDSFCRVKENTSWGQEAPTRYFHFCAYAYVLSKQGAQKVMRLLEENDGFWTSADHVLCNPVSVLNAYVMDPLIAGCFQDDDPKYATSQFNDFSRIDGFDSDLWNNDERWTADEISAVTVDGALDIKEALENATGMWVPAPVAPAVAAPAPVLTSPKAESKVEVPLARRFLCLDSQALQFKQLYECDWLLQLFGNPTMTPIERVKPSDPPPMDCPVVILQKPYMGLLTDMLEKWDSFGAKFYVLHLSDEQESDPLEIYALESCVKVLRFYNRKDIPCPEKVTTIPLGYHWTRREPYQDILVKTPKLPFRQTGWSFFGTDWNNRKTLMKPLLDLSGVPHKTHFLATWQGEGIYTREQYLEGLLDCVFVPCPDGVNPETFRFYEALECGCIPIVVRTERNSAWVDWVCEHLPMLPLESWSDAAQLVAHLLREKTMLEAYRNKILASWMSWKSTLFAEGKAWLT